MIDPRIFNLPPRPKPEDLTLEVLERCLRTAARVVTLYGDDYLPIFERMEAEVRKKKKMDRLKKMALEMTRDEGLK